MIKLSQVLNNIKSSLLKECTIAGVRLSDGVVLAKNRDRGYNAKMEIVHEIIDNVEVVYWHDVETDWSEGMNEFGIAVVNSSLMVNDDEKEGDKVKAARQEKAENKDKSKSPKHATDGAKLRQVLIQKNIRDAVKGKPSEDSLDKSKE